MREISQFQKVSYHIELKTGKSHLEGRNLSSQVSHWFLSWERGGLVLKVI